MTDTLAKPPTVVNSVGLSLPFTSNDIAKEHAADAATLAEFCKYAEPHDDYELQMLDADLSEVARLHDELVKRRQGAVGDVKKLVSTVEGWFRPYLKDIDAAITRMKSVKGAYLTAKADAAQKARQAAQQAAEQGDSAGVLANVQQAQTLESAPAGTRYAWEATVVNESMIPDEYWIVDRAKLDAVARGMGSAEEQTVFVPGVSFKRVAVVQARRK